MSDLLKSLDNSLQESLPLLTNVGGAVVLVLLVYLGYRLVRRAIGALESRKRISNQMALVTYRILRWVAVVVAAVAVLQSFGFLQDAWAFLSAVLALVAIGFVAVWSVMSNVLCSLILIVARPFQVGDTVVLPGQGLEGKVVNFTLLFTVLRDDQGDLVQIPNNTFFQTPIRRRPGTSAVSLHEQLHKTEDAQ
jgi:small-conductance mechanosensitive channel